MDVPEIEGDVRLYKASAELLSELRAKLPLLLTNPQNNKARLWVLGSKTSEVISILDSFQEWPQLLDPHLAELVQLLVDAFLRYCVDSRQAYVGGRGHCPPNIEPLPRSICRLLYVFCKVRGYKVIVRMFNNEPKYVEPMIACFRLWNGDGSGDLSGSHVHAMKWEERYIMLLWLSHLMLAPFELASISTMSTTSINRSLPVLPVGVPDVAANIMSLAFDHLHTSSKEREAAGILVVRLLLRGDMQRCDLPGTIIAWAVEQLTKHDGSSEPTQYHYIGLLNLISGIITSATETEAAPLLMSAFHAAYTSATSDHHQHTLIRNSAPARKLIIKIMRSVVVHAISLESKQASPSDLDLETMLEDVIQCLLEWLADKDTPVRQAASKALGMIALKLEADMSAEVIEAVLDCLNESMLLEDRRSGKLIAMTDLPSSEAVKYKKNVNAVDALKWHGAMLTLGHLLFRRSPPVDQLPAIIDALLLGLEFEQRSSVGTSIGVGVRDAACFGLWSLARKYTTRELNDLTISASILSDSVADRAEVRQSTTQLVATQLVVSACLDPSGNLRRGSSAALQELIGRHPDAIFQGIPVVQAVDYHAVARRSRAMIEVATAAAELDPVYHRALLHSLLGWRGCRATDTDSRRQASVAVGQLLQFASDQVAYAFIRELNTQINDLKPGNFGTNAAARHGLSLSLSAVLDTWCMTNFLNKPPEADNLLEALIGRIPAITGVLDGRVTTDLEHVLEATSKVISSSAHFIMKKKGFRNLSVWTESISSILHRCTSASDKDHVTEIAAQANEVVFGLLDQNFKRDILTAWLDIHQKRSEYACKGRISSLGLIACSLREDAHFAHLTNSIIEFLCNIVREIYPIETKVNAIKSIQVVLLGPTQVDESGIYNMAQAIQNGLADYTIDQRGDIGSLLRLQSIEAVQALVDRTSQAEILCPIMQLITKIAAERLTKIRFVAWKSLERYWTDTNLSPHQTMAFEHQADISSISYYKNILELVRIDWLRDHLILGLISSAAAGTEETSRACNEALVSYLMEQSMEERNQLLVSVLSYLLSHLESISTTDDREVVPAIDFLSFIIEQFGNETLFLLHPGLNNDQVLRVLDALQNPSASIARIEAIIRCYSVLAFMEESRRAALDKLTRKLLHKWPKVRGVAADAIFMHTENQGLLVHDWNLAVAKSKPAVLALRKDLGIAGGAGKA